MLGFCPSCGGDESGGAPDCEMCRGLGTLKITRCPHREIPPEISEFLEMADHARDGNFPILGGILQQSSSFLYAHRYLLTMERLIEDDKRKQK